MNTPITDAAVMRAGNCFESDPVVYAWKVRTLELDRAALMEALEKLLCRDMMNTCQHEETHRVGAIWEICDQCDAKWADDQGGKPEWKDPDEWTLAESALAAARANFA